MRAACPQTPRLRRHVRQSVAWRGVRDPKPQQVSCGPVRRFCAHGARVGTGVRCMRARLTRAAAATGRSGACECLVRLCALGGAVGRARHSACTVATRGRRACGATVLARVRSSREGAQGRRAPNGVAHARCREDGSSWAASRRSNAPFSTRGTRAATQEHVLTCARDAAPASAELSRARPSAREVRPSFTSHPAASLRARRRGGTGEDRCVRGGSERHDVRAV